jgi:hypothetical protein
VPVFAPPVTAAAPVGVGMAAAGGMGGGMAMGGLPAAAAPVQSSSAAPTAEVSEEERWRASAFTLGGIPESEPPQALCG